MSDNPYPDGSDTMHYELHTAWDEGYAEGFAAGSAADRNTEGVWPDQSAVHGVLLDQIKDAYAEGIADTLDSLRVRAAEMLPEVARFTLDEIELAAADLSASSTAEKLAVSPTVSYRVRDRGSDYKAMCHEDRDHAELLLRAWLSDGRDAVIERRHVYDGGWSQDRTMLDDLDAPSAMTAEAVRRRAMDDTGEPPERAELEARLPKCEACGHVQPEIERQVKWEVAAAERMGAAAKQAEIVKLLRDPASPLHHDVQLHTRTLLTAADLIERGGEQKACKHSLCQCDPATGRVECAHCGAVVERGGE